MIGNAGKKSGPSDGTTSLGSKLRLCMLWANSLLGAVPLVGESLTPRHSRDAGVLVFVFICVSGYSFGKCLKVCCFGIYV